MVTTNGKEANFLVGGEFPIPVVQGGANAGAVTIQFREFGIRLSFLPFVTPNKTIKMHVKPEVSTIDLNNAVRLSGFLIPALATRRFESDVELGEGQSFVIAGLLDDRVTNDMAKSGYLEDYLSEFGKKTAAEKGKAPTARELQTEAGREALRRYRAMTYNERQLYAMEHFGEALGASAIPKYADGSPKPVWFFTSCARCESV